MRSRRQLSLEGFAPEMELLSVSKARDTCATLDKNISTGCVEKGSDGTPAQFPLAVRSRTARSAPSRGRPAPAETSSRAPREGQVVDPNVELLSLVVDLELQRVHGLPVQPAR